MQPVDLKVVTSKPRGVDTLSLDRLVGAWAADRRVVDAYLYGSSLRSDNLPGTSDVDLLVVVADDVTPADLVEITTAARSEVPIADVTLITERELKMASHPSGSRHFFVSVARTGIHLYGANELATVAAQPLSVVETYRNAVQLCQRLRQVAINPAKQHERAFWLNKSQHWVPCLLMELLHLHGRPERRLRQAHAAFARCFPGTWTDVSYPYGGLDEIHSFMETLTRWLSENTDRFASPAAGGSANPATVSFACAQEPESLACDDSTQLRDAARR